MREELPALLLRFSPDCCGIPSRLGSYTAQVLVLWRIWGKTLYCFVWGIEVGLAVWFAGSWDFHGGSLRKGFR